MQTSGGSMHKLMRWYTDGVYSSNVIQWYYNGENTALHVCPKLWNIEHQERTLDVNYGLKVGSSMR